MILSRYLLAQRYPIKSFIVSDTLTLVTTLNLNTLHSLWNILLNGACYKIIIHSSTLQAAHWTFSIIIKTPYNFFFFLKWKYSFHWSKLGNKDTICGGNDPSQNTGFSKSKAFLAKEWAVTLHSLGVYWIENWFKLWMLSWMSAINQEVSVMLTFLLNVKSTTSCESVYQFQPSFDCETRVEDYSASWIFNGKSAKGKVLQSIQLHGSKIRIKTIICLEKHSMGSADYAERFKVENWLWKSGVHLQEQLVAKTGSF